MVTTCANGSCDVRCSEWIPPASSSETWEFAIGIDREVWEKLKAEAEPFVDTPNSVLRRRLGLDPAQTSGGSFIQPRLPGHDQGPASASRRKAAGRRASSNGKAPVRKRAHVVRCSRRRRTSYRFSRSWWTWRSTGGEFRRAKSLKRSVNWFATDLRFSITRNSQPAGTAGKSGSSSHACAWSSARARQERLASRRMGNHRRWPTGSRAPGVARDWRDYDRLAAALPGTPSRGDRGRGARCSRSARSTRYEKLDVPRRQRRQLLDRR